MTAVQHEAPTGAVRPKILIIGGGYVGMYTALRLLRKLRRDEADVVLVDPRSYMTYQPFLPEAAAGSIEPRHVVVPLRRVLKGAEVLTGNVLSLDPGAKFARIRPLEGPEYDLPYDHVVLAVGSISRTLPIPGLAEHGTGFKNVEEAIHLRNRVIECMDVAESTTDEAVRRRNLNFVVVGGGYAGVEALAELEDMSRYATRYYRRVRPEDLRWVLVEASSRILPEVGEDMGRYTVEQLRKRGIEVRLETRLESAVDGHIVLSDGEEFDTETLVWTAGVKPNPVVTQSGLPLDEKSRVKATAELRVEGHDDAWVSGDCAAVPDLTNPGEFTSPSAQHAVRQAKVLANNIIAHLRGFPLEAYEHRYVGSVASLGLYKGVAQVYGVKLRGFLAWWMHRTYHVSRVPTLSRKAQVIADWTLALLFRRDIVSLWSEHQPQHEFQVAAASTPHSASVATTNGAAVGARPPDDHAASRRDVTARLPSPGTHEEPAEALDR